MNSESLRTYCLSKAGVTESFPFDDVTLVFKVGGKMFLLYDITGNPLTFNVKCDPERAVQLRETYDAVAPGYHMNKTHWNTIRVDGSVRESVLHQWIDESYELVFNRLPKSVRQHLSAAD